MKKVVQKHFVLLNKRNRNWSRDFINGNRQTNYSLRVGHLHAFVIIFPGKRKTKCIIL